MGTSGPRQTCKPSQSSQERTSCSPAKGTVKHLCTSALLSAFAAGCTAPNDDADASARLTTDPNATTATSAGRDTATPPPSAEKTPSTSQIAAAERAGEPRLTVDPEGLRWFLPPNGTARPLPFGSPQAAVLASLERVRGEAIQGTNADCGAGPVQVANWADGLSLVFQDGKFAGWGLGTRAAGAIATADGIGPGTTRAQLDDAIGPPLGVRQTSLGTEFTAGAYHGVLDGTGPDARITDMWTGVSCVAR